MPGPTAPPPAATGFTLPRAPGSYDWSAEFRAFTAQHWATLGVVLLLMAGSCWLGRRWLGRGDVRAERRLRHAWIWTTIAWQTFAAIYYLLPENFDWYESLPLHLCDLAAWVAPFALLTQARWLRALLYFWGIGLSTQAFFTPVVEGGHADIRYWLFFLGHTQIVGSAVYDVAVLGFRPRWRDWAVVTGITLAWIVPVTVFNVLMDVNYGYTGRMTPPGRTLVEFLGPWPWRLAVMFVLTQVFWLLILVPWEIARRRPARPEAPGPKPAPKPQDSAWHGPGDA